MTPTGPLSAAGLLLALGCRAAPEPQLERSRAFRVPSADVGTRCYDVGGSVDGTRVCYDTSCPEGVCVVDKPLPDFAPDSRMGFRCLGTGAERVCVERRRDAGTFRCRNGRCEQTPTRVPDANEWSCADALGAQLCLEESSAAGVRPMSLDPGFSCGRRHNGAERLCLDLSPDFPDGVAEHWSCHYAGEPVLTRVCVRQHVAALGRSCPPDQECRSGLTCVAGRCVPPTPTPNCWLDADCPGGRCRLGSCTGK